MTRDETKWTQADSSLLGLGYILGFICGMLVMGCVFTPSGLKELRAERDAYKRVIETNQHKKDDFVPIPIGPRSPWIPPAPMAPPGEGGRPSEWQQPRRDTQEPEA